MPFSSLSEIQLKLNAGQTTAVEVAQLYLDRIDKYNDNLNAFVFIDADNVLAQAQASDEYRAKHDARPLEGLPIAVKDIFWADFGNIKKIVNEGYLETKENLSEIKKLVNRNSWALELEHFLKKVTD